jgi:O-antigen ligase
LLGYTSGRLHLKTGLFYVLKYFEYFIVYFMAVNHLKTKEQIRRFVAALLVVCMIICVIAILQIPAGGRVTAPFEGKVGEPNTLGGYLVLILGLALGLLLTPGSTKGKPFLGVLVFLIIVSLLATLSRSSWTAAVVMLVVFVFFSQKKLLLVVSMVCIAVIAPFITPTAVKERALYTVKQRVHPQQIELGGFRLDTSTSARIISWKEALTKDFIKHPLLGHGITGYAFMDAQYPKILVETGLLGLVAFLLLMFSIYRYTLTAYRTVSDPFFRGIVLGYLAAFSAMLVHAIGTNTFIIVRIMEPFWFLTAIIMMIPAIESGEAENEERALV